MEVFLPRDPCGFGRLPAAYADMERECSDEKDIAVLGKKARDLLRQVEALAWGTGHVCQISVPGPSLMEMQEIQKPSVLTPCELVIIRDLMPELHKVAPGPGVPVGARKFAEDDVVMLITALLKRGEREDIWRFGTPWFREWVALADTSDAFTGVPTFMHNVIWSTPSSVISVRNPMPLQFVRSSVRMVAHLLDLAGDTQNLDDRWSDFGARMATTATVLYHIFTDKGAAQEVLVLVLRLLKRPAPVNSQLLVGMIALVGTFSLRALVLAEDGSLVARVVEAAIAWHEVKSNAGRDLAHGGRTGSVFFPGTRGHGNGLVGFPPLAVLLTALGGPRCCESSNYPRLNASESEYGWCRFGTDGSEFGIGEPDPHKARFQADRWATPSECIKYMAARRSVDEVLPGALNRAGYGMSAPFCIEVLRDVLVQAVGSWDAVGRAVRTICPNGLHGGSNPDPRWQKCVSIITGILQALCMTQMYTWLSVLKHADTGNRGGPKASVPSATRVLSAQTVATFLQAACLCPCVTWAHVAAGFQALGYRMADLVVLTVRLRDGDLENATYLFPECDRASAGAITAATMDAMLQRRESILFWNPWTRVFHGAFERATLYAWAARWSALREGWCASVVRGVTARMRRRNGVGAPTPTPPHAAASKRARVRAK